MIIDRADGTVHVMAKRGCMIKFGRFCSYGSNKPTAMIVVTVVSGEHYEDVDC